MKVILTEEDEKSLRSFIYEIAVEEFKAAWISYVADSGKRRYVAVAPDDGQVDTTWGRGFFN
ncbi:hypothetical protein [Enterococcus crotali]|uniref:hypothetical protein n=1 Tax=Enterococcus crotali TaxID=1453587 RepID=UPI000471EB6D|nr:hypothetical protein [Enterococcus crotali]